MKTKITTTDSTYFASFLLSTVLILLTSTNPASGQTTANKTPVIVEKAETRTFQDSKSSTILREVKITIRSEVSPDIGDDLSEATNIKIVDDEGKSYDGGADCGVNNTGTPKQYMLWYILPYKPIPKRAVGKVTATVTIWIEGKQTPISAVLTHHPF